jgi:Ca2+-binding RTX toxin-like protein
MMILVGMKSIAGVLAFSGGIGGFDILGSTEEEATDQATPPTDVGEDKGSEPDTDTVISGGNYVDHMSGSAEDDLVNLGRGDDFYDGKQGDADAGDDTIHGEDGNDTIRDSRGNDNLCGEKGRDVLNAVDHVDHMGADTLIGGMGKDILQGDIGDVMLGGGHVDQFEVFIQDDVSAADDCVHILDFEPEKDKLLIRFDEPIEQDANPDRVIMTYDSRADATNVYADGKKVAEIFGVYPNELQDFYLGNFSRIA